MNAQNSIKLLQLYATGLAAQSQQHKIQGKVFASKGYSQLAAKYADHAVEEIGWVDKFIDRIIALGGEAKLEATPAIPILTDPVAFLKADAEVSEREVPNLGKAILTVTEDFTTFDLLKAYYQDEEEDLGWMRQQLGLIDTIGRENWLIEQL